jgi:transposase InsO family protein
VLCVAAHKTYVKTWDGWAYVATVIDLYSRAIVGYAIADVAIHVGRRARCSRVGGVSGSGVFGSLGAAESGVVA